MTSPILSASACPQCGEGGGGGECGAGEECLPSSYVAPCADGSECLPSDYIDPDDCPAALLESPDAIAGLLAWFDASDGATVTVDGDDRVTGWTDKAGSNDLVNDGSGGDSGPLYDGSVQLNGRDVVYYDSGLKRLSAPSGIDHAQPLTIFVVGQANSQGQDFGSGYSWYQLGSNGPRVYTKPTNGRFGYGCSAGVEQGDMTPRKPYYVTAVFNDPNSYLRANAVELTNTDDLGGDDGTTRLYVGSDVGAHTIGGGDGFIAELLIYAGALNAGDIALVEDYLLRKWLSDVVPAPECDYRPYCLNASGADLDALILGTTGLFAYYPLNDASGNPQDISGNAHHATTVAGTTTYQDTPISASANQSLRLNGAVVVIPPPNANPGIVANGDWSAIMLAEFHDFDTSVTANGLPGILSWTPASGSPAQFIWSNLAGKQYVFTDGAFACNPNQAVSPWVMDLDTPYVIALVAETNWITVYVDGVVWLTTVRYGGSVNGDTFTIGRAADTFWSAADWNVSNLAIFDAALAYADIQAITEAMTDAALAAAAPVFA